MIDKVGYTKPVAPARPSMVKRTGSADGTAFAEALSQAEAAQATEAAEAPVSAVPIANTSLLGLQEVNDEEMQRRKSLKHGRLTLEALAQLRDALLMGSLPMAVLSNLERVMAAERAVCMDPRLEAIMREIETRAAVELAKLEMSGIAVTSPRA